MKKIYLLLLPALAFTLLACNQKSRSEAVAVGNAYMDTFMKADVMEMANYSEPKIAEEFRRKHREDTTGYRNILMQEFMKRGDSYVLDDRETEIKSNEAEIVYRINSRESNVLWATVELDMIKIAGKWTISEIDVDYPND